MEYTYRMPDGPQWKKDKVRPSTAELPPGVIAFRGPQWGINYLHVKEGITCRYEPPREHRRNGNYLCTTVAALKASAGVESPRRELSEPHGAGCKVGSRTGAGAKAKATAAVSAKAKGNRSERKATAGTSGKAKAGSGGKAEAGSSKGDSELSRCRKGFGKSHDMHEERFTLDALVRTLVKQGVLFRIALQPGHTVNEKGDLHSQLTGDWGVAVDVWFSTLWMTYTRRAPDLKATEELNRIKEMLTKGIACLFKDVKVKRDRPETDKGFDHKRAWLVNYLGSEDLVANLPKFRSRTGFNHCVEIHNLASKIERDHHGGEMYKIISAHAIESKLSRDWWRHRERVH